MFTRLVFKDEVPDTMALTRPFEWEWRRPLYRRNRDEIDVNIPLLLPTAALGAGACVLWVPIFRPRARRGHCRCGYDLTGNVSGRCPQCGTLVRTSLGHVRLPEYEAREPPDD